jgi:hypothetical protein
MNLDDNMDDVDDEDDEDDVDDVDDMSVTEVGSVTMRVDLTISDVIEARAVRTETLESGRKSGAQEWTQVDGVDECSPCGVLRNLPRTIPSGPGPSVGSAPQLPHLLPFEFNPSSTNTTPPFHILPHSLMTPDLVHSVHAKPSHRTLCARAQED